MNTKSHDHPDVPVGNLSRRSMFKSIGGVAALASGCSRRTPQDVISYADRNTHTTEEITRFSSLWLRRGYAVGLLGRVRDHRPIKIEGHPEHPMSLGASGVAEEASLYSLYAPDRLRHCQHRGARVSWGKFLQRAAEFGAAKSSVRAGEQKLALLLEPTTSPTLASLLQELQRRRSDVDVYFDPNTMPTQRWRASRSLFGAVLDPQIDFTKADRVLSLDADLVQAHPAALRWARQLASRRSPRSPKDSMSRIYALSPCPTPTTLLSDHHVRLRSSEVSVFAAALLNELEDSPLGDATTSAKLREEMRPLARAIAKDLKSHRGRSVVVAGEEQSPATHVLAHALNVALKNIDKTLWYRPSPIAGAGGSSFDLSPLSRDVDAGRIETLVLATDAPLEAGPTTSKLATRLQSIPNTVFLDTHKSATSAKCDWVVPQLHPLEAWSDGVAYDGTLSFGQPLIERLDDSCSIPELLSAFGLVGPTKDRERLQAASGGATAFSRLLERGFVAQPQAGLDLKPQTAYEKADWKQAVEIVSGALVKQEAKPYELAFRPDHVLGFGEGQNNAWLRELPNPITSLSWQSAALVHPKTADKLGLKAGDELLFRVNKETFTAPTLALPGVEQTSIVLPLGHTPLIDRNRHEDAFWAAIDAPKRTGRHRALIRTQTHIEQHRKKALEVLTQQQWAKKHALGEEHSPKSLYPDRTEGPLQWGMAVDLSLCTGCSACVVACQAENNTPTVGPEQMEVGRSMHWLRVDRYQIEHQDADEPTLAAQPMACQHCEHAPCEYVCPTAATVHSDEGLNQMVYNRCVGTRFCSNNCPYKVRRFNFLEYHQERSEREKLRFNPDVTVRARGVMEKCTYCVQRIEAAKIESKLKGSFPRDVNVQTACEQACPTQAIVFGNIKDASSDVSKKLATTRRYGVLAELGTRPRTQYLAKVRNPNPKLT